MSLPFETITQRALRNIRQLSRRIASLYPAAYENVEGETTAVVGNDAGPYVNALGRASTDGTLGSVVVENGDPQIILTDELGDYDFTAFPITCATGIAAAFSSDPYTYLPATGVGVITIRVL